MRKQKKFEDWDDEGKFGFEYDDSVPFGVVALAALGMLIIFLVVMS